MNLTTLTLTYMITDPDTAAATPPRLDPRYTFGYEYCGRPEPRHVARFCGSWIGQHETLAGARKLAEDYHANRMATTITPDPNDPDLDHRVPNPIVAEITKPGRTDGVRAFQRLDGTVATYDPASGSVREWERLLGVPLPPWPPSPELPENDYTRPAVPAPRPQPFTGAGVDWRARCYQIPDAAGGTSLSFEDVARRVRSLAHQLGLPTQQGEVGSIELYQEYVALFAEGRRMHEATGGTFICTADLTPQLMGHEGRRVWAQDHAGETRRFEVLRSSGWMPCHLERAADGSTRPAARSYAEVQLVATYGTMTS